MLTKINQNLYSRQRGLQKKFNKKDNKIITFLLYKTNIILIKSFICITKIDILTNNNIKINFILGHILKYNKKNLSIIFKENHNKFIFNLNIKSPIWTYE